MIGLSSQQKNHPNERMKTNTCFSNSGSNNECTLTSFASVEETWRTFAPVKALKASFGAFAGLLDFTLMDRLSERL